MIDIIVIVVLLAIFTLASVYIYKQKKKGVKCVGCPYSGDKENGGCSCNH